MNVHNLPRSGSKRYAAMTRGAKGAAGRIVLFRRDCERRGEPREIIETDKVKRAIMISRAVNDRGAVRRSREENGKSAAKTAGSSVYRVVTTRVGLKGR